MNHWTSQYIGRPYDKTNFTCGHLLVEVEDKVFDTKVDIAIPESQDEHNEAIASQKSIAEQINTPIEGCGVLINSRGIPSHIGIYTEINGVPYVLHALERRGVCLHRISTLRLLQMEVAGYYKFRESK